MNKHIYLEIEDITSILEHPSGYDVGNGGIISVRRYEHPMWAVEIEVHKDGNFDHTEVKEFSSALEAATYFVTKRRELKIGLDYEII